MYVTLQFYYHSIWYRHSLKRLYNMPDESRLMTIPDAVTIQFVLLKMGMLMLETCPGL